jgi:queuine/archaeosine tRNA-ribosyltransferase
MNVLAIYYIDPVEGRQKFVVPNPSKIEQEHYLWVARHIQSVPEGHSIGVFGATMVLPIRTHRRDWLLSREGIRTIRMEEIDKPEALWKDAA